MTVTIQTFNRAGWPADSPIQLSDAAAAAVLTAARDYQAASGRDLRGDYLAAPLGGLRTVAEVEEMQTGFDLRKAGKAGWQAIYEKYNMDQASKARPSLGTHTTGNCADISDNGFLAWLKNGNAKRYGLVFTLSPPLSTLNDLRHAQFFPGTATVALDVTSLNNTPTETDLAMLIDTCYASHNSTFYIVHGAGCDAIPLSQRSVWNQRVLGLITDPWDDANLPFLGSWAGGAPANYSPGAIPGKESDPVLLGSWLAGRGIPVVPTPDKPYRFDLSVTLTDTQLAAIGAAVKVPAVDTSALSTAIAALDKQADDYQAQLEATLAKGLTISGTAKP